MSKYVGGRIVPKHCGTWNSTKTYETLSVVLYADTGDSYMSRKAVPAGVDITDTEYWAKSADFSEQLNDIKATVQGIAEENAELKSQVAANVTASTDEDADYAAELVDARVDDEGMTHESAGEAIRTRIGELDETLFDSEESSYTNTGTSKTSAKTFALSFTEDVYLKTLCPQFTTTDDDTSVTGTFTWWVVATDMDVIADSSSSDKATVTVTGTKHSASIGDIIEVNQKMTTKMVLIVIPDDTDTRIMYLSSGAELATARLCYPSGKIGFITPHARKNLLERTETYVEAIETACKNYGGIPVFNNVKNGGLCFWNDEQAAALTLGDGCHYSADGMEWFSWKYEAFLRSL